MKDANSFLSDSCNILKQFYHLFLIFSTFKLLLSLNIYIGCRETEHAYFPSSIWECLFENIICMCFIFISTIRAFISIWKENILKIWNRRKGIYVSYSSPRVTVSHTLMIHMEFMCLFMLSFIWGRVGWRKEAVYTIFLNTSGFCKKKKNTLNIILI